MSKISLTVLSSKDYEYIWKYFAYFWFKYCNNLKIDKFFLTASPNPTKIEGFTSLNAYPLNCNDSWSLRIRKALESIKTEYILLFTEDCIPFYDIDIKNFNLVLEFIFKNKIKYFNLSGHPRNYTLLKKNIYEVPKLSFHVVNLQPAIWERESLIQCLNDNLNPKTFELELSKNNHLGKIYFTNFKIIPYIEIIRKGKISKQGVDLIIKYFPEDNLDNKKMNFFENLNYKYSIFKDFSFSLMPKFIKISLIKSKK